MTALRAAQVNESDNFSRQVEALLQQYPMLKSALTEFTDFLRLGYIMPEAMVDPKKFPNVYAIGMDYPAAGSGGLGTFLVTYHAVAPKEHVTNPMTYPSRVFTLLTISERPGRKG
jgi:hypothetical protein